MNEFDLMKAIGGVKPGYLLESEKKRLTVPDNLKHGVHSFVAAACLMLVVGGVLMFARGLREDLIGAQETTDTPGITTEEYSDLIGEITASDVQFWYDSLDQRMLWSGVRESGVLDIREENGEPHPLTLSYEGGVYLWTETEALIGKAPTDVLTAYISQVEEWCEENGFFLDYITDAEYKSRYTPNVDAIIVDLKGSFTEIRDESDERRLMAAIESHDDKQLPILAHIIRTLDIPRDTFEVYAEKAPVGKDSMLSLTDEEIDVLYSGDDARIRKTFCAEMAVHYDGRNFTVLEFRKERTDLAKTQDILPDESERLVIRIDGIDLPRRVVGEMYEKVQVYAASHEKAIEPGLVMDFQAYEYVFADRESFEGQLKARYQEAMVIAERYFRAGTVAVDNETLRIDGDVYNRALYYETMADLKNEVRAYFSEELTERLFAMRAGDYIEHDGKLYVRITDLGTANPGLGRQMYRITRVNDRKYVYSLTVEMIDTAVLSYPLPQGAVIGYRTYDYVYENIDGGWVFTEFPYYR